MKMQAYCIQDKQAKRAMQPFFRENDDIAVRDFRQSINQPESPFYDNPDDYTLLWIGEWDDKTLIFNEGRSDVETAPHRLLDGGAAKNEKQRRRELLDIAERLAKLEAAAHHYGMMSNGIGHNQRIITPQAE